jgi:hypothetical protein
MSANNRSTLHDVAGEGLAADAVAFCAKQKESRSGRPKRQVDGRQFGGLLSAEVRQPLVRTSIMSSTGLIVLVEVTTRSVAFVI